MAASAKRYSSEYLPLLIKRKRKAREEGRGDGFFCAHVRTIVSTEKRKSHFPIIGYGWARKREITGGEEKAEEKKRRGGQDHFFPAWTRYCKGRSYSPSMRPKQGGKFVWSGEKKKGKR